MTEAETTDTTGARGTDAPDELHAICCCTSIAGSTIRAVARLDGLVDPSGREDWQEVRNYILHAIADDLEEHASIADRLSLEASAAKRRGA